MNDVSDTATAIRRANAALAKLPALRKMVAELKHEMTAAEAARSRELSKLKEQVIKLREDALKKGCDIDKPPTQLERGKR